MLEEFKDLYESNYRLRSITWAGLLCAMMFLVWAPGGFPPQAWLLFLQLLSQLPHLWDVHGASVLFPFLALFLLSLVWLLAWGLLLWICAMLVRHHRRWLLEKLPQWVSQVPFVQTSPSIPQRVALLTGGQITMDAEFSATAPKLRLPQRHYQAQRGASLSPIDYQSVQEIPTRPSTSSMPIAPATSIATISRSSFVQPLEVGVGWNTGIKRQRNPNEDSLLVLQSTCTYQERLVPFGLFVVADGMGGHDCGLEASRIAIQNMMHTVLQNIVMSSELSDEFLTDMLVGGVEWANMAVFQRGKEWHKEMGTTLTAALVVGTKAYVANVGDSRTYLYRSSVGLRPITRDHSVVATLVAFGEITPDQAYTHPDRNKVYRSIGNDDHVDVDWFIVDLCQHDTLLLCSDGLWEMVRNPEIERILRHNPDAGRASEILVRAALLGGGADNVSVIIARVP